MDEGNNLILANGIDNTGKIDFCKPVKDKWQVKFLNSNKVYPYNYENITWLKDPKVIDHTTVLIYENNHTITGMTKILDFGDYIKLVFKNGYKKTYKRSSLVIEETCLSNNSARGTFDYLKTLASYVSVKDEKDNSFLSKQYEKLTMISPRSVLATYLSGNPFGFENRQYKTFYPFGFNISQKSAKENALKNQVSVIEGPPGTGKTQTILNIIANAVMNDKTVEVVSNNNSATANIL
ncbi:AAA family ATPase [Bacillus sp. MM2020_1]|nr:AAA family ATPase [Bacillus sp. MM2020_1]